MDNWHKIRKLSNDKELLELINSVRPDLSIQEASAYLYTQFSSFQYLLQDAMLTKCNPKSYIICQIINRDNKLLKMNRQDNAFANNLQLLMSQPHKLEAIYTSIQSDLLQSRLQLEEEFTNQKQLYSTYQFALQSEEHQSKRIKIQDSIELGSEFNGYLNQLSYLMDQSNLVIVTGPFSSGKSTVVNKYIEDNNLMTLTLYMDPTIDFNSLIGQFVCTEQIGVFKHSAGPLLHCANLEGTLILKNFQEASEDFFQQLKRALNLNYVLVGGDKQFIRKLKIIAISSQNECTHIYDHVLNIPQFTIQQLIAFAKSKLHKALLVYIIPILEQVQPLMKDVVKLCSRWQYHINQLYGNDGITNDFIPEQIRIKLFLETIEILLWNKQLLIPTVMESFGLQFPYENYNPNLSLYEGYMEFTKLGQIKIKSQGKANIIYNQYSSRIIEKIMTCVLVDEPCLLIGDTGCGKTTLTQHCAELCNKKLHIFNLSEGSDSQDLIGGFRPLNQEIMIKLTFQKFLKYFTQTVDVSKNAPFINNLHKLYQTKKHQLLLKCMKETTRQCIENGKGHPKMTKLYANLESVGKSTMSFYFLTGNLIKAMKHGDWVLIDEINLATNELLQKLLPAIQKTQLLFYERGDEQPIKIHPEFRLFGCMNPGTDVGKKELPANVRNRFTQIHLQDLVDRNDLMDFIRGLIGTNYDVGKLADLYLHLKTMNKERQIDEITHTYSLRNLSRALQYYKLKSTQQAKSMFDGLSLAFASGMTKDSLNTFYAKLLDIGLNHKSMIPEIGNLNYKVTDEHIELYGFKINRGPLPLIHPSESHYLITPSNFPYLMSCLRCLSGSGLPLLMEGPTSGGKTSLVYFLSKICGIRCHRINNHQHTEVEEYLGTYAAAGNTIQFQEGLLVQALKNGDWIILDELNLARSEILENLNRLLDDNQELFLPETQAILKPHRNFRIFATQNPISYSGRKQLSKAFRNRFIEIQVDEISSEDLTNILQTRCPYLPPTYIPLLRQTQQELNVLRSSEHIFMQQTGMITLRDLIKWGGRMQCTEDLLTGRESAAMEGYCVIGERIRDAVVKAAVKVAIEKIFKVSLNPQEYYMRIVAKYLQHDSMQGILWNKSFVRMAALTMKCVLNKEPALLVGPAGIGKTTLVGLLAEQMNITNQHLVCHQYIEISDFVGALRPSREHGTGGIFQWQDGPLLKCFKAGGIFLIDEVNMCPESVLEGLNSCLEQPPTLTVNDQFYAISNQTFAIVASMNPSGDWGKKELTPALRSRFTEIYADNPLKGTIEDIQHIVEQIQPQFSTDVSQAIYNYNQHYEATFRDLLQITQWIKYLINLNIDGSAIFTEAFDFGILQQLQYDIPADKYQEIIQLIGITCSNYCTHQIINNQLMVGPYSLNIVNQINLNYPPQNLYRLVRAISFAHKPIMIQGPESCGKRYIIEQLGYMNGKKVVTILFDEQSDLQELLGTDQPNSSLHLLSQIVGRDIQQNTNAQFRFIPGPLLDAITKGHWLILKNLNLAPQNVLEGLNSILDHRQEIFIPELGEIVHVHEDCRIFAVQNPMYIGEGRKGLPLSFMNRFIRMHFQEYSTEFIKSIYSNQDLDEILSVTRDLKIINNYIRMDPLIRNKFYINQNQIITTNHVDRLWIQQSQHFSDLINSIHQIKSVIIVGQQGIGKQHFIKRVSRYCGEKLIHLILNKQTDSQELLGQYEQLDEKGKIKMYRKYGIEFNVEQDSVFFWRFSQLVEAAIKGQWVLIDNVDNLNKEILPRLVQFVEQSHITMFGEEISIHKNFKIFLTASIQPTAFKQCLTINMNLNHNGIQMLKNYTQDVRGICNNILDGLKDSHYITNQIVQILSQLDQSIPLVQQSIIAKKISQLRQIIENQLIQHTTISRFEIDQAISKLFVCSVQSKEIEQFWDEQILDRISNKYIVLNEAYDKDICLIQNNSMNHQRITRRILNQHYKTHDNPAYIYCEYLSFNDANMLHQLIAIHNSQILDKLNDVYQQSLFQLSEQHRSRVQALLKHQITTATEFNELIINKITNQLINKISNALENKLHHSYLIIIFYLIDLVDRNRQINIDQFDRIVNVENSLSDPTIAQCMIKNKNEWERQQAYDYVIHDGQAVPELQEFKKQLSLTTEQLRDSNQLLEFLVLLKQCLKSQQYNLTLEWIKSLQKVECPLQFTTDKMEVFLYENDTQLLHNYNALCSVAERLMECEQPEIRVNDLQDFISYQKKLPTTGDLGSKLTLVQTFIDTQCLAQDTVFKSTCLVLLQNPLQYEEDNVINYIMYLKKKQKCQSLKAIQQCSLQALIQASLYEVPYYQEMLKRYHTIRSLSAYQSPTPKALDLNNILTKLQSILDISDSQIIQISSIEIQVILIEAIVNEIKQVMLAQEQVDYLTKGMYLKQNPQYLELLSRNEQRIVELRQQLFIRHPRIDNIEATYQFVEDLRENLSNLMDHKDNQPIFKKLLEQWMISSYSKFYYGFRDILTSIYEICIFRDVEQQVDGTWDNDGFAYQLSQKSGAELLEYARIHLINQEERDLFKMDDAKLYTLISRKIEGMVVDEYTNQAKEDQKQQLEQQKEKEFHTYRDDFEKLAGNISKTQLTERVRSELSSLDYLSREFMRFVLNGEIHQLAIQKYFPQLNQLSLVQIPDSIGDTDVMLKLLTQLNNTSGRINVYRQCLPSIVIPLTEELMKLLSAIRHIQNDSMFSENEVLYQIGLVVAHLLNEPAYSTPLIKFITGLTIIMEKVEQWNASVPKAFHLTQACTGILKFIIEWRRMERDGWKCMLQNKIMEFWCVESIILFKLLSELDETHNINLTLDLYLRDSQIGNYEIRIILLNFVLKQIPQNSKFRNNIEQKLVYYSIFNDAYNSQMKTTLVTFSKEVEEYRKLVSWESKNYVMVQQASDKMHGKLAKVSARFRVALNEKFNNLITKQGDQEYQDSTEAFITKYKLLSQQCEQQIYTHQILENIICTSFERIEQLKEAKSNAKITALKNYCSYIEAFLGLNGRMQTGKMLEIVNKDLMLKHSPKSQLDKAQKHYYKSLYLLQRTLTQQVDKSIPASQIYTAIALIYDYHVKHIQIFKLISQLIITDKVTTHNDQMDDLHLYVKCLQHDEIGISLSALIKTPTEQLRLALIANIQSKFTSAFDVKYQTLYHILKSLLVKLESLNFAGVAPDLPNNIPTLNPKVDRVWNKYMTYISNSEEHLLQGEIKILVSLNKHQDSTIKDKLQILIRNLETSCKLQYFMTVVFCNLFVKGFCQKDDQSEGEGEGEGDMKAGTGIGEGKGQQNVTKEIEFEEQLLGQQGEEQEQEEEEEQEGSEKKDEDEFDMENDFNGKNKPTDQQQSDEENPKDDDDVDQGFSSVEEDDNENLKNDQGQSGDEESQEQEKNRKKSDLEYNAEQDKEQKELQAKQDKEPKENNQKRNLKEFEETNPDAQSQIDSDQEDNGEEEEGEDGEEKSAEDFGGKGGEQLEEQQNEDLNMDEDIDQEQEGSLTMDEEEQLEQQEQMQEEDVKFNPPNEAQQEEQEDVQNKDLFKSQSIEQDEEQAEQQEEDANRLFVDQPQNDDQIGDAQKEQGQQGKQGQMEEEKEEEEGNEGKGQQQGKQKEKQDLLKQLFKTLEQHLNQQDMQSFKRDLNVHDEQAEEMNEDDNQVDFQINYDAQTKQDRTTNLPIMEQNQKSLKEQFMKEQLESEKIDEQDKQMQQQTKDENGQTKQQSKDQLQGEQIEVEKRNQENPPIVEIVELNQNRMFKESNVEELIKIYQREGYDIGDESDIKKGALLWGQIEREVITSSIHLCEELKTILAPTQMSALKGDFKTGKRLNMKKIIPYIASNFRKDKIWLRRTQPQKRTYQIMLALDDSLSMSENQVGHLSLQSLTSLALALSKMEAGQISIASIHEGMKLLHDFNKPFSSMNCPFILGHYSFEFESQQSSETSMMRFMRESLDLFKKTRQQNSYQICFIISDGKFNKKMVKPLVREAEEARVLYMFIILDREKQSITNIRSTNYIMKDGKMQIEIKSYLEDFPFKYYIIIKSPNDLNSVLVNILRQHYQMCE